MSVWLQLETHLQEITEIQQHVWGTPVKATEPDELKTLSHDFVFAHQIWNQSDSFLHSEAHIRLFAFFLLQQHGAHRGHSELKTGNAEQHGFAYREHWADWWVRGRGARTVQRFLWFCRAFDIHTFRIFLFQVIKDCKSAQSEKKTIVSLRAAIHTHRFELVKCCSLT